MNTRFINKLFPSSSPYETGLTLWRLSRPCLRYQQRSRIHVHGLHTHVHIRARIYRCDYHLRNEPRFRLCDRHNNAPLCGIKFD